VPDTLNNVIFFFNVLNQKATLKINVSHLVHRIFSQRSIRCCDPFKIHPYVLACLAQDLPNVWAALAV
jgi:hypothetical protein